VKINFENVKKVSTFAVPKGKRKPKAIFGSQQQEKLLTAMVSKHKQVPRWESEKVLQNIERKKINHEAKRAFLSRGFK
jgi:tRNA U54 and U55 pseudouridine synthase Pus10